jgi:hypothetical protein
MTKTACQYAIVQFMPFVETGEFANVGIAMLSGDERYFGFKLQTKRSKRVTDFFNELDARVFKTAMVELREELSRVHQVLKAHGFDRRRKTNDLKFARGLFNEVTRTRETMVRFGEPRAVLATDPKETLDKLYAFYIEREFVTKQYRETILEKGVRHLLFNAHVGDRFRHERLGDEEFTVPFPFVEFADERALKVIKPLNLAQEKTTQILEHGNKWQFRIRELQKRQAMPEKALFAVEGPTRNRKKEHAYLEAVEMLGDTGVTVLPIERKSEIVEFALA